MKCLSCMRALILHIISSAHIHAQPFTYHVTTIRYVVRPFVFFYLDFRCFYFYFVWFLFSIMRNTKSWHVAPNFDTMRVQWRHPSNNNNSYQKSKKEQSHIKNWLLFFFHYRFHTDTNYYLCDFVYFNNNHLNYSIILLSIFGIINLKNTHTSFVW